LSIRIYLTGRVALEVDERVVIGERQLRGKQGRVVFAYLVCERGRPVSREELATVIWPENLSLSWEAALSSLTSKLGTLLSSDLLKAHGVLFSRGFRQYQVHLPADVWIDLEAATSALDRAEAALRARQPASALGPAAVAASIARRPFLSGVNGFWQDFQRRKLERQLLRALDCICQMQIRLGEPASAVETAIEAVSLDPYRELTHQYLMQAYAATGNRAMGVSIYHQFRKLLADELGSDPSPETEALYLKLLS
jgi:DNA-binding SARP family transcriptional activator